MGKWCGGRKTMLEEIEKNIFSKVNGYSWNGFIFQIEETDAEEFCFNLENYLKTQEMSYVFEKYNLKDVWWGSPAGIFLANIVPPITGFKSLEESKEYLNYTLPYAKIIRDPAIILNKDGSLQTTWKYRESDLNSAIKEQLAIITQQLNTSFQGLDTDWVLYFETQRVASTTYATDVFFPT